MNSKKKSIIILMALVFLIIGALFAYKYLQRNGLESNVKEEIQSNNIKIEESLKEAYDFTVYNEIGDAVKLSDFKEEKNIVVNFWASWCPPCKEEMPYFNEATEKYKNEDVEILMINLTDGMRETKEIAKKYLDKEGYKLNVLYDLEEDAAFTYRIQAVPRTIFIDKNGKITVDHVGLISKEDLNKNIESLLKN